MKAGVIRTSLFAAADAADVPDAVAIQLADVFGGEIDFHRDLRKGDRFAVVYEVHAFAGRPVRAGRVLAAEFVNQGRSYRAVHYDGGYYSPEGGNLRKAFLRAPLEFSRVSSGFGRRLHPLFRTWRTHEGVDYAAPTGTKVRATGDGVVDFVGQKGGYGRLVVLRHGGSYSTAYAHLSRFAPGLRRGARIAQGDTLGYVGQTGWATGPHLHYEFRVAGAARNPRTIALPAGQPVPAAALAAFRGEAGSRLAQLDLLADSRLALLE
jgi:murein DD-endopeptidase MepM/ murein hydrolase activator NlpD